MAEIVINNCYGGYGVSPKGVREILKRKGFTDVYLYIQAPYDSGYDYKLIPFPEREPYQLWYIATENLGNYLKFQEFRKAKTYRGYIDREDKDLIACIREFGSEFMSCSCAELSIEEYDDENYIAQIDEYDGSETLELCPIVNEKRIAECKSTSEIMDYLESLGIDIKRKEA